MKEFLKKAHNAFINISARTWHIIFISAFLILIFVLLWQRLTYKFITAEFKDLRPINGRINVFYKGYKIGKVLHIKPSNDFKTSYMKIALFHNGKLKLPKNSIIKLQREKDKWRKRDYIDIIYPENPVPFYIENGDLLLGKATVDIETFLSSQEPESLDNIRENMEKTSEDLQGAVEALRDLLTSLNEIAQENKENLTMAAKNLSNATANINSLTRKFNSSIQQQKLDNTMSNIDNIILNTKNSTAELERLSKRVDDITDSLNSAMPDVTSSIETANNIAKNISEITCGISNTLKKRFGGLRLIFGKTIDENCDSCKNCGGN